MHNAARLIDGPDALRAALADLRRGQVLRLAGGQYGAIRLHAPKAAHGLVLASQDLQTPAIFDAICLEDCTEITLEGLVIEECGEPQNDLDSRDLDPRVAITRSSEITLRKLFIRGDMDGPTDGQTYALSTGLSLREARKITISGLHLCALDRGITVTGSQDVTVRDSRMEAIGAAGVTIEASRDVHIEGLRLCDFHPRVGQVDLPHMICLQTLRAAPPNSNITLRHNQLDIGTGAAAQAITVRSETDAPKTAPLACSNLEISGNLITTAACHGIAVDHVEGLRLDSNVLLHNDPNDARDSADIPQIMLGAEVSDMRLTQNIACQPELSVTRHDWVSAGNTWIDPADTELHKRCHAALRDKLDDAAPWQQTSPAQPAKAPAQAEEEIRLPATGPVAVPVIDIEAALKAPAFRITMRMEANREPPAEELLRLHRSFMMCLDDEGDIHLQVFTRDRQIIELCSENARLGDMGAHEVALCVANGLCALWIDDVLHAEAAMDAPLRVSGRHDVAFSSSAGLYFPTLRDSFEVRATPELQDDLALSEVAMSLLLPRHADLGLGDSFDFLAPALDSRGRAQRDPRGA